MKAQPSTFDRIVEILQRDLKLGSDIDLAPTTALFGGELDLDSLDALLLVQSIEKDFDIKVPTEAIGAEIFASMSTLTEFVQQQLGDQVPASTGASAESSHADNILDSLPHRPPFRFVTGDVELSDDGAGRAVWRVSGAESFFDGHFPGHPIVPGVLIGESLAQLSGLIVINRLAMENNGSAVPDTHLSDAEGKLVHIDLRFSHSVSPPADIALESRLERKMGSLWQFDVRARVADGMVAEGALALSIPESATNPANS